MEQQNKQQENKSIINVNNSFVSMILNLIEGVFKHIKELGVIKFIGYILVLALSTLILYIAFNPTMFFEIYDSWKTLQHHQLMDMRMSNAPKIQSLIDKLTFRIDASRILLLELHNGNTSIGGIPFTKCSATFESLNVGIHPVATQYQNQNLSLIPFASKLFDCGYWCGDTEELIDIDKALYHRLKSNNTEHFAACVIEGIDKPLAFLMISFDKTPGETHDCKVVRENIRHIAMELAVLMEVERMNGYKISGSKIAKK